ncbi:T9SS type A sorting domain-containing protein [Flavobacterium piscisymbiosum]|uniref:T9SS type A sorting domain-containing protein n=1 Tax=Flavobacterium piscisymbiosum TaxID=2893753 RepID=A0ABS8MG91_9FLAO|nr:T9SS type A sorting domain-containing protein [Flavobacterium sp. F-30]MCC9064463.1 T9SS type A sorting domain-containing protein [Flavobacterium sp. F-30]
MKRNQPNFLLLFITSILFITNSYSQESIVVSGGAATGSGGTSNYSIGQIAYTGVPGSDAYILQGVQQPYEIITLGTDEFTEINLLITAFPNPAIDILNLVIVNDKWQDLSCTLSDISGKTVSKKLKIASPETSISMQGLNQGIYFLSVNNSNKTIKTFKIIKK